jgi:hypothetical protein
LLFSQNREALPMDITEERHKNNSFSLFSYLLALLWQQNERFKNKMHYNTSTKWVHA